MQTSFFSISHISIKINKVFYFTKTVPYFKTVQKTARYFTAPKQQGILKEKNSTVFTAPKQPAYVMFFKQKKPQAICTKQNSTALTK